MENVLILNNEKNYNVSFFGVGAWGARIFVLDNTSLLDVVNDFIPENLESITLMYGGNTYSIEGYTVLSYVENEPNNKIRIGLTKGA